MKTGALFEFCCQAGPILAQAGTEHQNRLKSYARDFGLVFQITDDLLDVVGSTEKTGKAVGKDKDIKDIRVKVLGVLCFAAVQSIVFRRGTCSTRNDGQR